MARPHAGDVAADRGPLDSRHVRLRRGDVRRRCQPGGLAAPAAGEFQPLGYWFAALAIIIGFGAVAALAKNVALGSVLGTLALGALLAAIFYLAGGTGWERVAGWVFIVSAALAAYTTGAMMIAAAWGRAVLPVGELHRGPSDRVVAPLEYELGEPGVKRGQ